MFLPIHVNADYRAPDRSTRFTYFIILLTIVPHLYLFWNLGELERYNYYYRFGMVLFDYHWWAALTCTLLHGSWMHLAGNLYFLWLYGRAVEKTLGATQFLTIYIVGAFVSVNFHLATLSSLYVDEPLIGASGAISSVLGAFFVLFPRVKLDTLYFDVLSFRPIHIELPAWVILGLWFMAQLLYTLQIFGEFTGVAFWAHVGGFVAGAGLGTLFEFLMLRRERKEDQQGRDMLAAAWRAQINGDQNSVAGIQKELSQFNIVGDQGGQPLLGALIDAQSKNDAAGAMAKLLKAFQRGRDYRDYPKQLTTYLQMLKLFDLNNIPAAIHRDAGLAAAALKKPELALWSYGKAIAAGVEDRLPQLISSLQGILRHKLQRADLADEVEEIMADG